MKIRFATLKDLKFVKELDEKNMKSIIESLGEKYGSCMFEKFNSKRCFIIESNKKPIGFAYFQIPENKLNIWNIQIDKNFQRKGYGKKLMEYLIKYARKKKLKKVILEAHASNKQAIDFYEKIKFKNIGKIRKNKIGFEKQIK